MTKDFITKVAQEGTLEDLKGLRGFTNESEFLEKIINQLDKMQAREDDERSHPMYRKYNNFWVQI